METKKIEHACAICEYGKELKSNVIVITIKGNCGILSKLYDCSYRKAEISIPVDERMTASCCEYFIEKVVINNKGVGKTNETNNVQ